MTTRTPAYDDLALTWTRMHRFGHLMSIAGWDQAANMPPKGVEARAAAMAEMAALLHRMRTDPALRDRLERAEQEDLDVVQRANLREMRRAWQLSNALPEKLVQKQRLASSRCEHAWRRQRPANDWAGFLANFREVLALAREEAALLSEQTGLSKYEAMMDRFEPGMTSARLDGIFGEVRQWLPGLVERVIARQAAEPVIEPQGPFPVARQRALCERTVRLLGFDFDAGRLDVSTHPFCGGVPEDVRMTTRFREDDFLGALTGTIHETGHGRYEQNRPREWLGQGLIRVEADELSYGLHIVLRYELELALLEQEMPVEDLPQQWNQRMQELLGLQPQTDAEGCLQDIHWAEGLLGYFPSYALGHLISAQLSETFEQTHGSIQGLISNGEECQLQAWLGQTVWPLGRSVTAEQLVEQVTGRPLSAEPFLTYLRAKVAELR